MTRERRSTTIMTMDTVIEITNWDMISTPEGGVVVILPPIPLPRCILVAADAIYIGTTAATIRLLRSKHLSGIVGSAVHVVIAEADDMIRRETAVDLHITHRDFAAPGGDNDSSDGRIAA